MTSTPQEIIANTLRTVDKLNKDTVAQAILQELESKGYVVTSEKKCRGCARIAWSEFGYCTPCEYDLDDC